MNVLIPVDNNANESAQIWPWGDTLILHLIYV